MPQTHRTNRNNDGLKDDIIRHSQHFSLNDLNGIHPKEGYSIYSKPPLANTQYIIKDIIYKPKQKYMLTQKYYQRVVVYIR